MNNPCPITAPVAAWTTALVAAALGASISVIGAGCSKSLDSTSRGGLAVAASTSGQGFAPSIVVTSPAPGAWVAGPDVTIEGRVRLPGKTVRSVEIAGVPAVLEASGAFKGVAHLQEPGLNTVTVRATDAVGADSFTHVTYVRGPFATGEVTDALHLVLETPALAPGNAIAEDELKKLDLQGTLRGISPVALSVVNGLITVDLDFVAVTHAPPTAALAFGTGAFDVVAEVKQISLDAVIHDRGGAISVNIPVNAKARSARATARASLVVPPNGGPVTCVMPPAAVTIDDLVLDVKSAIPNLLAQLLKKKIESVLEAQLAGVLDRKIPKLLDRELAALATPQQITVNGAALDFSARLTRASVTPAGCTISVAADAAPSSSGAAGEFVARGAQPPFLGGAPKAAKLAISQDLLSKALTTLWRAGALDMEIRGTGGASSSGLPLDGAALAKLVPELAGAVPAATPLVIRLRPRCPPELRVGAGPSPFRLVLGELHLEILADLGGALDPLLTVSVHAEIPVDASLGQSVFTVKPSPQRPRFLFAVVAQPKVRVDELRLATRLTVVADAILPKAFVPLAAITLPTILGRTITDGELSVPAPGFDHMVVGASLR